jgi:hypothetical protein
MMKFYREGARRILAGQKKKSTIEITAWCGSWDERAGKMLTGKRIAENPGGARDSGRLRCGKAEDGSGKPGGIRR